ncbi:MAG: nucleoid occlusion factor SlmA, partial [Gammaproteobacteria bacterium]|nr:nucleoid occlusion factor SlmA [Gammaproteobacteria bacterium]
RKQAILEALANELEQHPGDRITTAALARAVGVSEAALYRHFPSKARMFEGLIGFAEESVFARINQILDEEKNTQVRVAKVIFLLLGFADRNPGITRVLLGDALVGERERLHERVQQFFERIDVQLRQILREAQLRQDASLRTTPEAAAGLLTAFVEGRMQQFLRSRFSEASLSGWEADWGVLSHGLFDPA